MTVPTYPITGIRAGWGDPIGREWGPKQRVPVRVEADDFFLKEEYALQRDLLYQAMTKYQKMPISDKLSYFQVAGIHGLPHVPWDAPGSYAPQYCEHGTDLFASWHRPYMLLFEQRLYEIMINQVIPLNYPAQHHDVLKVAADRFRMPYWDWALKKPRTENGKPVTVYDLPLIVKSPMVAITDPTTLNKDQTVPYKNPFYKFQAPGEVGEYGVTPIQINRKPPYEAIYYNRTITTSRLPPPGSDSQGNRLPPPDDFYTAEGIAGLAGAAKSIQEAVWYYWKPNERPPDANFKLAEATYRLLSSSYFNSFPEFVTAKRDEKTPQKDGKYYFSLETVHNNVHNWTGQGWGHMAHVPVAAFDPIFWLHHCNIDRLMAIWQELNPKKWFEDSERAKRPLSPFHTDTKGTPYNANSCKDFFSLGYTYPELQPWNFNSQEAYQASIRASNSQNYRPPASTLVTLANKDVIVNVSFKRFALDGVPFTVRVLLGDKVVGEVYNFSTYSRGGDEASEAGCQNCQSQQAADLTVTGQVFMSEELAEAVKYLPGIKALTEEEIKAYVKQNLKSEAYLPNGDEVTIPGLEVTPFMGQREVFKVSLPPHTQGIAKFAASASEHFVDGHVHALSGEEALPGGIIALPGIGVDDLPYISARWDEEGNVVLIYGHEDKKLTDPIAAIRAGGWGAYTAF